MKRTILTCSAALSLFACSDMPESEPGSSTNQAANEAEPRGQEPAPANGTPTAEEVTAVREHDTGTSDAVTSLPLTDGHLPGKEDGVSCELRHRSPDVYALSQELETDWMAVGTTYGASALEVAPDGSAYMIGTFGNTLSLGAERLEAHAFVGGFLHKLGSDCAPIRTQQLRPTHEGDTVIPAGVAVDAGGNVYVASVAGPMVDFEPWFGGPIPWVTEIIVEKFSPAGESLYRTSMPTQAGGSVRDMEVDSAGQVYLSGTAPALSNLGNGLPVGLSPFQVHSFTLALDARGKPRAQRLDTGATRIEVAGDHVYTFGDDVRYADLLLGLLHVPYQNEPSRALSAQDASFQPLWQVNFPQDQDYVLAEGLANAGVALAMTHLDVSAGVEHQTIGVRRYAKDGTLVRDTVLAEETRAQRKTADNFRIKDDLAATYWSFVRETPEHGLAMGALIYAPVTLGDTRISPSIDPNDMPNTKPRTVVVKLDSEDRVQWAREQEFEPDMLLGVSPAPNGDVFVTGLVTVSRTSSSDPNATPLVIRELVVRKLRAH